MNQTQSGTNKPQSLQLPFHFRAWSSILTHHSSSNVYRYYFASMKTSNYKRGASRKIPERFFFLLVFYQLAEEDSFSMASFQLLPCTS
jgi:hypothetical protein